MPEMERPSPRECVTIPAFMSRETKFGYGFLLVGCWVPYLVDKMFGATPAAVAIAVIGSLLGVGFLFAGHLHRDDRIKQPWGLARIVRVSATLLLFGTAGWTIWHFAQKRISDEKPAADTSPSSSKQREAQPGTSQTTQAPIRPPSGTAPDLKAARPNKPKTPTSSGGLNNSSTVGGNITQGPCSNLQIGGTGNSASTNCGPQLRFPESSIVKLAELLAAQHGTVSIDVKNADSMTSRDANNLLTAFAKAHSQWATHGVNQTIHGTDIGADGLPIPDPVGIHVHARSERLALAEFVKKSIKQAVGIESYVETDESVTSVDIAIIVGAFE
jgi:hypothetical protein